MNTTLHKHKRQESMPSAPIDPSPPTQSRFRPAPYTASLLGSTPFLYYKPSFYPLFCFYFWFVKLQLF